MTPAISSLGRGFNVLTGLTSRTRPPRSPSSQPASFTSRSSAWLKARQTGRCRPSAQAAEAIGQMKQPAVVNHVEQAHDLADGQAAAGCANLAPAVRRPPPASTLESTTAVVMSLRISASCQSERHYQSSRSRSWPEWVLTITTSYVAAVGGIPCHIWR